MSNIHAYICKFCKYMYISIYVCVFFCVGVSGEIRKIIIIMMIAILLHVIYTIHMYNVYQHNNAECFAKNSDDVAMLQHPPLPLVPMPKQKASNLRYRCQNSLMSLAVDIHLCKKMYISGALFSFLVAPFEFVVFCHSQT